MADRERVTVLELLPGGHGGAALGVNDGGVVVGSSGTADGTRHAVLWRDGRITDLGTLGGWHSAAIDVNRRGVVVGRSDVRGGTVRAFVWTDGQMTDLGTLGGASASATAINDHGWVVGHSTTADGVWHPFVWKAGEMTDLGAIDREIYRSWGANDIDDEGRIVGSAMLNNDMNAVPVMWENGKLRRLTNHYGQAMAINSRGQVAGCLSTSTECFVWSRDGLMSFGADESPMALRAHGIDRPDRGSKLLQVEGIDREGRVAGWTGYAAFIWHRGEFEWLPRLTTGQSVAKDISDQGSFVVGCATTPSLLASHAVVWPRQ